MTSIIKGNLTLTPYNEVTATRSMHRAPRFGHPNNISLLFSDNQDDVDDYMRGLIFIAGFCLALFLIWAIVLMVLKCIGMCGKRGGIWSGHAARNPGTLRWMRGIFMASGIIAIVFTVLLVTLGIDEIHETANTMQGSNRMIHDLAVDADTLVENMLIQIEQAKTAREGLLQGLSAEQICPPQQQAQIVLNKTVDLSEFGITAKVQQEQIIGPNGNVVTVDVSILDTELFRNILNEIISRIQGLADFATQNLLDIQDGLKSVQTSTEDVDTSIEDVESGALKWPGPVILVLYIPFTALLLIAAILSCKSWTNRIVQCITDYAILPIFILLIIVAILISCVFSIPAVANADFCSGSGGQPQVSPDATVMDILVASGWDPNSFRFLLVQFYVRQCFTPTSPFEQVEALDGKLDTAQEGMQRFSSILRNADPDISLQLIQDLCSNSNQLDLPSLDNLLNNLRDILVALRNSFRLVACDRIVPIYTNTVYDGTCTNSVTGFTWTFSGFLIVAFMGMVMITTRSALHPLDEEEDDDDDVNAVATAGKDNTYDDDNGYEAEIAVAGQGELTPARVYVDEEPRDNNNIQSPTSKDCIANEPTYAANGNIAQSPEHVQIT